MELSLRIIIFFIFFICFLICLSFMSTSFSYFSDLYFYHQVILKLLTFIEWSNTRFEIFFPVWTKIKNALNIFPNPFFKRLLKASKASLKGFHERHSRNYVWKDKAWRIFLYPQNYESESDRYKWTVLVIDLNLHVTYYCLNASFEQLQSTTRLWLLISFDWKCLESCSIKYHFWRFQQ